MKKLLSLAAVCLFVLALCSCGGGVPNTPEAVTTKAIQCIIDKDYKGYVDLMYFKKEMNDEGKEQLVTLVQDKMEKEVGKKDGIKDFTVGQPTVDENKAIVPYALNYGNGDTKEDKMKLIKNEEGEWLIDSGK